MPLFLCPNDNSQMQKISREGVDIDICPSCKGVWLDRGELDKIIEKSLSQPLPGAAAAPASPIPTHRPAERYDDRRPEYRRDDDDDDRRYPGGHKGYRRKS